MSKTQLSLVRSKLEQEGAISRNWCLSQYLTRCAAYINDLRNEGWDILGEKKGNDYIYTLKSKPHVPQIKIIEKEENGIKRRIAIYV